MNRLIIAKSMLWVGLLLFVNACAFNQISDYDGQSLDQMQEVAKKVDYFYAKISYDSKSERTYQKYAQQYLDIEVDLNALKFRQDIRAMNELTVKQVEIAQSLWNEDRVSHQKKNTVSDFIIKRHRQQFNRIFLAMIKGEDSKPKQ